MTSSVQTDGGTAVKTLVNFQEYWHPNYTYTENTSPGLLIPELKGHDLTNACLMPYFIRQSVVFHFGKKPKNENCLYDEIRGRFKLGNVCDLSV
jgi:hypothetical protein